jgi:hypothetical protein
MASHPTYDPGKLDDIGISLAQNKDAPLVNRAAQGTYLLGNSILPLVNAAGLTGGLKDAEKSALYQSLGFYESPQVSMSVANAAPQGELTELRISPFQMAIAISALSNHGVLPAPRIVLAVNTPQAGWIVLPALGQPEKMFSADKADQAATEFGIQNHPFWEWTGNAGSGSDSSTWYLSGTLPYWKATPLALVVLLEANDAADAQRIGQQLLQSAITP